MSALRNEDIRTLAWLGLAAMLGMAAARSADGSTSAAAPGAWEAALHDARNVDVNQANASELERLPGVGRVLAARMVAERQRRGRFAGPEDLLRVPGIGPATVEKIEMFVSFD